VQKWLFQRAAHEIGSETEDSAIAQPAGEVDESVNKKEFG
jgi:hypothetical protein